MNGGVLWGSLLRQRGPGPDAFTFRSPYPEPAVTG